MMRQRMQGKHYQMSYNVYVTGLIWILSLMKVNQLPRKNHDRDQNYYQNQCKISEARLKAN